MQTNTKNNYNIFWLLIPNFS